MSYEESYIEGRNAVMEALRSGRPIDKLYILDGCHDGPVSSIRREAKKRDSIIKFVEKEFLDRMSSTGRHQGVIAVAAAYEYAEVEDILKKAEEIGADTVAEGTNADDEFDYRPGMKALKELGIRSPLKEAGLTKEEIRKLSAAAGLNTWNKPSFACLATRIPQGDRITAEGLLRIEKAEDFLKSLGVKQYRVRTHGDLARIEVIPQDMVYIMRDDVRLCIDARFRELGYRYVSVDIRGYRTGNMNRPS